ncbi:MAG: YkvA family protein [Burkholderiales bacterium]
MGRLRDWAGALRRETLALYYAARDPRTPWHAKLLAAIVVGYALSPIDLIPDFIPVLGYLDDLLLLPIGIALTLKLVPAEVLADARARAAQALERPRSIAAAAVIVALWIALAAALGLWLAHLF